MHKLVDKLNFILEHHNPILKHLHYFKERLQLKHQALRQTDVAPRIFHSLGEDKYFIILF